MPLAQALEAAWVRALQAREADARSWRADAQRVVANSPWAGPPSIELSHRDDRVDANAGQRETEAGLAWPLWLPGQRAARLAAADAEGSLAQAAVAAGRLALAGSLRAAWHELALARADMAAATEQAETFEALAADVRRRVEAGDLARADALAANAEVLGAEANASAALARLFDAQARWQALTGTPAPAALADDSAMPAFEAAAHPDIRFALLDAERARRQFAVITGETREAPELALRIRQDVAARGAGTQHSLGIGIRIPFATDSRNSPRIAAAREDQALADLRLQRLQDSVPQAVRVATQSLQAAQQSLAAEERRASLLAERSALVQRSFNAGETSLPEALRAATGAAQARRSLARQRVSASAAQSHLLQVSGIAP